MPPGELSPCCICAMQQHWLYKNASLSQPNIPDCGGARLSGNRRAARACNFSCRCTRIFLMTTGSSMQAMTLADPPQTRHISTSISPKAPTVGENTLQPSPPGAYFWCAQVLPDGMYAGSAGQNRSWPHDAELAFAPPGHPLLWACYLFPVLLTSPALGACCSAQTRHESVSG